MMQIERLLLKVAKERHGALLKLLNQSKINVEFVHDLRVATRRLSEVVAVLGGDKRALKKLRKAAGELRDLDVICEHLQKWAMPRALKTVAKKLVDDLQERRSKLEKKLQTVMRTMEIGCHGSAREGGVRPVPG